MSKRDNFTVERITGFAFKPSASGKSNQSVYWDGKTPGLGLRVTSAGVKSFIFETRLNGKTLRLTIGDVRTWPIGKAQAEARRLKAMTDVGVDPRQVRADEIAARESAEAALALKQVEESATVESVWKEYLEARKPYWSERHYHDHLAVIHRGGAVRTRRSVPTVPGPLASLAPVRLVDLTPECVDRWAKDEGARRPTSARLSLRLLKAFLSWCARHSTYKNFVVGNSASSKTAKESLGRAKVKNDVLQREQLSAWFRSVRQLGNQIVASYLQALLLTGARRNELASLKWVDVDFQWNSLTIGDKIQGIRVIPLTPFVKSLLAALPRRSEWVFSSPTAASGHLTDPNGAHVRACNAVGLTMTIHGLRRSFATLSEWVECPAGIAAQIQGHAPQGVREQNYIRRPLDLLRMWHTKIEAWILEEAGIAQPRADVKQGLQIVA